MPVAGNVHPDANSVETVQPSGSGSERSDTIMTGRAVRPSRLSERILSGAVSVVMAVYRGISTVRNVLNVAGKQPVGEPKAAIGRNSISIRVQTDTFVFRKTPFLAPKTAKKFSEFGEGVS